MQCVQHATALVAYIELLRNRLVMCDLNLGVMFHVHLDNMLVYIAGRGVANFKCRKKTPSLHIDIFYEQVHQSFCLQGYMTAVIGHDANNIQHKFINIIPQACINIEVRSVGTLHRLIDAQALFKQFV